MPKPDMIPRSQALLFTIIGIVSGFVLGFALASH